MIVPMGALPPEPAGGGKAHDDEDSYHEGVQEVQLELHASSDKGEGSVGEALPQREEERVGE